MKTGAGLLRGLHEFYETIDIETVICPGMLQSEKLQL